MCINFLSTRRIWGVLIRGVSWLVLGHSLIGLLVLRFLMLGWGPNGRVKRKKNLMIGNEEII